MCSTPSSRCTGYRQWVADGKKTSVEEGVAMSNRLICTGLDGFRNPVIAAAREKRS